jgi:two-component system, sensor histidine kinase
MAAPSQPKDLPRLHSRLRDEQVAALFRSVAAGVTFAALGAIVLATLLVGLGVLRWSVGGLWVACVCACAIGHLQLRREYRASSLELRRSPIWSRHFALIAFAEGAFWGWISVAAIGSASLDIEMVVMVVTLGIAGGSVPCFGAHIPSFLSLFVPATLPFLIWCLCTGGTLHESLALLMLIYIAGMGAMGLAYNRNFNAIVELRLEKEDLAEELRIQKDIAERANLEKSQFLASASHDLRQPVHALGLILGALRGVRIPDDGLKLIDQLEASLLGLDNLFRAVLDISRLDAGVLEVRCQTFAIQPIFDRVAHDFSPSATAKHIRLAIHSSALAVYSDPILVERILRNLVENAIRYTDHGRVVVGCRRAGLMMRVEVWDTGRGIPETERQSIFREFYQIREPGEDYRGGLGLGLAIVHRLGQALGAPLSLRSRAGHGSVFSFAIPRAEMPSQAPTPMPEQLLAILRRAFIVVIDDDDAIRNAMESLLLHWGHRVVTAPSGEATLAALAKCPDRPDLIITDYRLGHVETGLDVIRLLNAEYNDDLPAILITGETRPEQLQEVHRSGCLVLHKPVPDRQLRAAIGNLLRQEDMAPD